VEFIHCVGCWDYECRVEVESAEQLAELRRELHEQFEQDLASIRFVNILRNTGTEYGGFFGTLEKEFLPNTEEHGSLPYTSVSMAIKDSKNGRASSATPLNLGA
jgi:DNA-directed RNA polymerase alpha subunit